MITEFYRTGHVLVDVKGVKKSFGGFVVLDNLDLQINDIRRNDESVEQAQVVAILGPSGIGKSTFLNAWAGLIEIDSGEILIDNPAIVPGDNEIITTEHLIPTKRGLVGMVYQDYRFFPFMKVEKLLREGMKMASRKNSSETHQKFDEYLDLFGLFEHRNKFSHQLSGGQQQRVAIMQQLMRSPQLLVMDEPFSGLDPESKDVMVNLINELAKKDEYLTIVIVSHDIGSALRVSDTIYMMGRNRDGAGKILPGSSIHHSETIDMATLGLAWHNNDPEKIREIDELERKLKRKFSYLSGKPSSL